MFFCQETLTFRTHSFYNFTIGTLFDITVYIQLLIENLSWIWPGDNLNLAVPQLRFNLPGHSSLFQVDNEN